MNQVSTNGFISMGVRVNRSSPEIPGTSSVIAPYAADIDPTEAGTVRYTQFTTDDYSQMSTVSSFIQARTDEYFYGTTMMVAEWNGVPEYAGSPVSICSYTGSAIYHVLQHINPFLMYLCSCIHLSLQ